MNQSGDSGFWQGQTILLLVKMKVIRVKETWTDYDAADVATVGVIARVIVKLVG